MLNILNMVKIEIAAITCVILLAHGGIHIFHPIALSSLSDPFGITDPGFPG